MRTILFIIMIALLTGCGPSKKILKTDITTTTNTETKKVDTSSVKAAWEDILKTVVNQVDLSKIRITTYYPVIDSATGKQPVKSDIEIDHNIKTNTKTEKASSGTEIKNAGMSEEKKENSKTADKSQITEKKTGLPIKYYFIGFAILVVIGYFGFRWIKKKFLL